MQGSSTIISNTYILNELEVQYLNSLLNLLKLKPIYSMVTLTDPSFLFIFKPQHLTVNYLNLQHC